MPVNLLNHIVGSTNDLSVPVGLFPVCAVCIVDPNGCGWDPPSQGRLWDMQGFTIMVDPPETLLPRCGGSDL